MPHTFIYTLSYKSPAGEMLLGSYKDQLCLADWRYRKMRQRVDARLQAFLKTDFKPGDNEILRNTAKQLDEYFHEGRRQFDVPLKLCGSDFQQRVWQQLLQVPYGITETYLGLSRKLGDEKAIRAVASANGANAISVMVPCHRIVGSDGSLTGYAGGLEAKRKLLRLEGVVLPGIQPVLF